MADIERICELIQNLSTSGDIYSNLVVLKTALFVLNENDLRIVVNSADFRPIFQCLGTLDRSQIEVCTLVLERLMMPLGDNILWQDFHTEILRGLDHNISSVKLLCLGLVKRLVNSYTHDMCQSSTLLHKLISLLASSDIYVATQAMNILISLGQNEAGLNVLYSGETLHILEGLLRRGDTIRYRVLQMALNLSCASPAGLARTAETGLLRSLLDDLRGSDALVQLNSIELLSDLSLTRHGLVYLVREGLLDLFMSSIRVARTDALSSVLLPSVMKFFGNILRMHPKEILSKYPDFMDFLTESITGKDVTLKGLAVETTGFVGSSPEGKMALAKLPEKMKLCLQGISRLLYDAPSDLRVTVLRAISSLLQLQVCDQTSELLEITNAWFGELGEGTFSRVVSIAKQPFSDLRGGAHAVFQSLAMLPWGQRLMLSYPGFSEYLLDRGTEHEKASKESKFEIVNVLVESPTIGHYAAAPLLVKLREFHRQGPFFVRVQAEVAMEGEA